VFFILTNSFAPIGLGLEFFIGNFGIGPTFVVGSADAGVVLVIEPGAYARFYFGDLESTFYITGGVYPTFTDENVNFPLLLHFMLTFGTVF
jgi:hypothetical protein